MILLSFLAEIEMVQLSYEEAMRNYPLNRLDKSNRRKKLCIELVQDYTAGPRAAIARKIRNIECFGEQSAKCSCR